MLSGVCGAEHPGGGDGRGAGMVAGTVVRRGGWVGSAGGVCGGEVRVWAREVERLLQLDPPVRVAGVGV